MKCFFHQDRDAVGICKSCERGVCPECAVDLGKGLACRGRCEEDARKIIAALEINVRTAPAGITMLRQNRSARLQFALFFLVFGMMLFAWGFSSSMDLSVALGGLFCLFGILSLVRAKRIPTFQEHRETTEPVAGANAHVPPPSA